MFKNKWVNFLICVVVLWIMWVSYNIKYDALNNKLTTTQENLQVETEKTTELTKELSAANEIIADLKDNEYKLVYMGEFKITHYCDQRYDHICGGNGMTASGKPTDIGWTAAADWDVLPKGSVIYISGIGFREVQDVGGAVNNKHVDVLVEHHSDAMNLGIKYKDVWVLVKKS